MTCMPESGCWCAELPKAPMPVITKGSPKAIGCFCRACLCKELERQGVARPEVARLEGE